MGKGERQKSARERIKEAQAADRQRDKRRRILTYVTVGVVAVGAVTAGWLYSVSKSRSEEASSMALAPVEVVPDGSVTMAKPGVEKPVIDVFEDFQCPACKGLEEVSGQTIKNLAAEGKAKVVYHPITIFGQEPTRGNSVRAGAAARCVSDGRQWLSYHDKLFKNQPSETVEGFKTGDLVAWGKQVGVTAPDFESCVTSQKYADAQVAYSDKVKKKENLSGTPTVKLNGKALDNDLIFSPQQLREAVLQAAK